MSTYTISLTAYLLKHHAIDQTNALIMIEEEWEYIEEQMNTGCSVEFLAKELVEIYMAA